MVFLKFPAVFLTVNNLWDDNCHCRSLIQFTFYLNALWFSKQ